MNPLRGPAEALLPGHGEKHLELAERHFGFSLYSTSKIRIGPYSRDRRITTPETERRLSILHTPGHTPDSVSILVTDKTRAPEPWFVLTGDTLFSGGVGRPDLIGAGSETTFAEQLHESLYGKLLQLPDHLEVFPAHFGGAACGKGLSGKPGSTIGFERRFNPALRLTSKSEFVQFVLADLPPQPEAFAENRRRNLTGE